MKLINYFVRNIKTILLFGLSWYLFDACSANPYKSGEVLYGNFCASCHGKDGEGFGEIYPPIANSDYLKNHADELTCLIKYGMWDTITVNGKVYKEPMPENLRLDDIAINNIVNYVNYAWPYKKGYTTIIEVRAQLEDCQ